MGCFAVHTGHASLVLSLRSFSHFHVSTPSLSPSASLLLPCTGHASAALSLSCATHKLRRAELNCHLATLCAERDAMIPSHRHRCHWSHDGALTAPYGRLDRMPTRSSVLTRLCLGRTPCTDAAINRHAAAVMPLPRSLSSS